MPRIAGRKCIRYLLGPIENSCESNPRECRSEILSRFTIDGPVEKALPHLTLF